VYYVGKFLELVGILDLLLALAIGFSPQGSMGLELSIFLCGSLIFLAGYGLERRARP
jgi:hypothetical protein